MNILQKIILLIVFILITPCAMAKSNNISIPEDIRVGLYYNSSAKDEFTLSSAGGIQIGVMKDGEFIFEDETNPNEKITISKGSTSYSINIDGYGEIGLKDEYPYFKSNEKNGLCIMEIEGKKYRGNIEVRRLDSSDMTVINHLSMQEYLYGVVPREIGGNSHIEAVKAQAIVARTYACKNYNKRVKLGFNVMPTVDDQAYGGYEWEVANSNKAVDETNGQVVVYDGELIGGYYFSTSGGYTENSENVWVNEVDYLKAVPDTYEPVIEGNTTWEVTMSEEEVRSSLKNHDVNVGEILDLVPTKYTDSGRILELKVVGSKGEEVITKDRVRTYLGLKSQWYSINDDAPTIKDSLDEPSNDKEVVDEYTEVDEDIKDTKKKSIITKSSEKKANDEETDNKWYLDDGKSNDKIEEKDYSKTNEDIYTKKIDDKEIIIDIASGDEENNSEDDEQKTNEEETQNIIIEEPKVKPLLSKILGFIQTGLVTNKSQNKVELQNYKAISTQKSFTFRGRGWGHAVGMSQNGAKGMAQNGFSAEEIIKWYYSRS